MHKKGIQTHLCWDLNKNIVMIGDFDLPGLNSNNGQMDEQQGEEDARNHGLGKLGAAGSIPHPYER